MPEVNKDSPQRRALGKTKSNVQKITDDKAALQAAYRRLFGTRDGKLVLADLLTRFYDNPMDGDDLNREAGRRDVLHFIRHKVTL